MLKSFRETKNPYKEQSNHMPSEGFYHHTMIAKQAVQTVGDGWCVIGDASGHINPFLGFGVNYGSGQAYHAAHDVAVVLMTHLFISIDYSKYFSLISPIKYHSMVGSIRVPISIMWNVSIT